MQAPTPLATAVRAVEDASETAYALQENVHDLHGRFESLNENLARELHDVECRLHALVERCNEVLPMVVNVARRQLTSRLLEQQQMTQQQQRQQHPQSQASDAEHSPLLTDGTPEAPEIDENENGENNDDTAILEPRP